METEPTTSNIEFKERSRQIDILVGKQLLRNLIEVDGYQYFPDNFEFETLPLIVESAHEWRKDSRELPQSEFDANWVGSKVPNNSISREEKQHNLDEKAIELAQKAYKVNKWSDSGNERPYEIEDLEDDTVRAKSDLENMGEGKVSAQDVIDFFSQPGQELKNQSFKDLVDSIDDETPQGLAEAQAGLKRLRSNNKLATDRDYAHDYETVEKFIKLSAENLAKKGGLGGERRYQFIPKTEIEKLFSSIGSENFNPEDYDLGPEFKNAANAEELDFLLRELFNSEAPEDRTKSTLVLMKILRLAEGQVSAGFIKPYMERADAINRKRSEDRAVNGANAENKPILSGEALWGIYFSECQGLLALGCDDDANLWLENIKKVFGENETKDRLTKDQLVEMFKRPEFTLAKQIYDSVLNNPDLIYKLKHYKNFGFEPPDPNNPDADPVFATDLSDPAYLARKKSAGEFVDDVKLGGTDPANFIKNYFAPALRLGYEIKLKKSVKTISLGKPIIQQEDIVIKPGRSKGESEENAFLALHQFEGRGGRAFWSMVGLKSENGISWFDTTTKDQAEKSGGKYKEGDLILQDEFLCWSESNPNRSITLFDAFMRSVKKYLPISPEDLERLHPELLSSRTSAQAIRELNRDMLVFMPFDVDVLLVAFGFQPLSSSAKIGPGGPEIVQAELLRGKIGKEGIPNIITPPIPKLNTVSARAGNEHFSVDPSDVILGNRFDDENGNDILKGLTKQDPVNWGKKMNKMNEIWKGVWEALTKKPPSSFEEGASALRKVVQDEARNVANDELSLFQIELVTIRLWGLLGWLLALNSIPFDAGDPRGMTSITNATENAQGIAHILLGDIDGLSYNEVTQAQNALIRPRNQAAANAKHQKKLKEKDKPFNPLTEGLGLLDTLATKIK